MNIDQSFEQAVIHHQAGRLQEAEQLYLAIIQAQPNHAKANYNLGMMKDPAAALPYLMAALEANPAHGQYWLSYVNILFQSGQIEVAREVLALAQQQGLQGDEVEALAARLKKSPPTAVSVLPHDKKSPKAKSNKSALKTPLHKPKNPDAQEGNTLLALFSEGRYIEAKHLAQKMTEHFPLYGFGWKALGTVFMQMGQNAEALAPMQKAVMLSPDDAYAHSNLGNILSDLARLDEAEISLRQALRIDPNFAEAYSNLGSTLQDMGRIDDAIASHRHALRIKPNLAEGHYNLGNGLKEQGCLAEAEISYRRALQLKPDYAQAHSNLGITLNDLGRPGEAEASLRLALQIHPAFAQAYSNLGNTLRDMGRLDEAEANYRRALEIKPDLAEAYSNLGNTLRDMGYLEEAEANYRRALEIKPDHAETYNNLGNILQDLGRLDEAEASYRQALQIKPDHAKAHSNLLFSLNYSFHHPASYNFAEARQYGDKIGRQITSRFTAWLCAKQPERLRIGFVSGDFRNHPVGYFLESLLTQLDSTAVELFAYPTNHNADEFTARIKPHFAAWKPLFGLNDETAARLIHSDGIHVLIDLSGHTGYNRLPMFAWKPAPVQVSWLGYFATTGVAEIDYLIADAWTLPETEEAYFTEKIWRLPETRLCFTRPEIDMEVSSLPALLNGYVTFGCFNNLTKMNDDVVTLWSRVLVAVPGSRLFLKAKQLMEASVRQRVIERFAEHGIDASRLIMEEAESREKYLAAYRQVDIALDPFPYPGGTTSVESLWMGVPVLTLSGERFLPRQGIGILMNAGLPEWIAVDADDYVKCATSHAADLQRLAKLRAGLRQRLQASPVMDAQRFAFHFEAALCSMWRIWCEQSTTPLGGDSKCI